LKSASATSRDWPGISASATSRLGISYKQAENRYTKFDKAEKTRALRHQQDEHFGSICKMFDTKQRRCTVYEARPGVCREYPDGKRCGYYEFLNFEREHQDDPTFVAVT